MIKLLNQKCTSYISSLRVLPPNISSLLLDFWADEFHWYLQARRQDVRRNGC
ncbi:hypothetical protein M408DRAFT_177381 [Serendipita vermifera MAFF 305830]|uniref:Uncharacterized protein n=1 Tax=Serendipita vermifera MAFF 305830 TaxID=933852 RepID=A0A0C2WKA2_SERVB|nr:hypothetical protein M408DRAFT_177381 [Serendipita vermifera MAFF 305830]